MDTDTKVFQCPSCLEWLKDYAGVKYAVKDLPTPGWWVPSSKYLEPPYVGPTLSELSQRIISDPYYGSGWRLDD